VATNETEPETGECHVCGETVALDGKEAGRRYGNVLCYPCSQEPVVFEATCTNQLCSWQRTVEDREFNRGDVKKLAQSEANNHETTKRVFEDDPTHATEVLEVESDGE
jgi:hypothetical protein